LPAPTGFTSHEVGRTRFKLHREYFRAPSLLRGIASKAHPAPTAERHTGYNFEIGNVAVPAELRTGLVLGNHRV